MNEIATAKVSKNQAETVLNEFKNKKGTYSKAPKVNSYVTLQNDVTVRHLHLRFRSGNARSKAFQLKGNVPAMRAIMRLLQQGEGKSITLKIK